MNYGVLAKAMLAGSAGAMMADDAYALNLGPLAKKFKPQFSSLMDRKPRMEISDRFATLNPEARYMKGSRVEDILDHPELYENYPDIGRMPVYFDKDMHELGNYLDGTIRLNPQQLDNRNMRGTLLHEIQHAIQEKEGYARGGSVGAIYRDKTGKSPEVLQGDDLEKYIESHNEYQRLAGEIESRDVADRAGLTMAQRQQAPHYSPQGIPLDDTIVRYRNMAASQALQEPVLDPVSMFSSTIGVPSMLGKMAAALADPALNYMTRMMQPGPYNAGNILIGR